MQWHKVAVRLCEQHLFNKVTVVVVVVVVVDVLCLHFRLCWGSMFPRGAGSVVGGGVGGWVRVRRGSVPALSFILPARGCPFPGWAVGRIGQCIFGVGSGGAGLFGRGLGGFLLRAPRPLAIANANKACILNNPF